MSPIAAIAKPGKQDYQLLLAELTKGWLLAGTQVAGMLARRLDTDQPCSAGFLWDIASGKDYSVHLDAAPAGTSCHLDAAGMEEAGAVLLDRIPAADVVVLSKFGKLEAMRRGLWPAFQAVARAGKPLLTTVSPKHMEAWNAFAPDTAWLDAEPEAIGRWWQAMQARQD